MKHTLESGLLAAFVLFCTFFASCSEERNLEPPTEVNPYIEQLLAKSDALLALRDNTTYGSKKDQFPYESREILDEAIAKLSRMALDIAEGKQTGGESLISQAIAAAQSSITAFNNEKRIEDLPFEGVPAELYVDGLDGGYIDFGKDAAFSTFGNFGQQAFTVECWVKMEKVEGTAAVVGIWEELGGGKHAGWMINYTNRNFMRVSFAHKEEGALRERGTGYLEPSGDYWGDGGAAKGTARWTHLALSFDDANTTTFYINGHIRETKNQVWKPSEEGYYKGNTAPAISMTAFAQQKVGGTDMHRKMSGCLKHFHIWKKALSESEVRALMNQPAKTAWNTTDFYSDCPSSSVTGKESDLLCGWSFDETVENSNRIPDLTGKFNAKVVGSYQWREY